MATIAEFTIPADQFPLGELFSGLSEATIELERIVPTGDEVFPNLWISGVDTTRVLPILEEERLIRDVTLLANLDRGLFRVEWNSDLDGVLTGLTEAGLTLLTGVGTADEWYFEVRTDDSQRITDFQEYCRNMEPPIPTTLDRVHGVTDVTTGRRHGLTQKQREALEVALEEGYFNEPREITLEELASKLDITRTSVSSRLRRGQRALLERKLTTREWPK